MAFVSQGTVSPDPAHRATPPFLVSRQIYAALKAGDTAHFVIYGLSDELEFVGLTQREVEVDGQIVEVSAIEAAGTEITAWILDDAQWPILLGAEFEGNNYVSLISIEGA
ncbi:MAG: hypothetical protein H0U74_08190 [Bradymonadaceae bacterium]|nr:hypothetical protein [Lujinxingiaceae bacterium]